MNKSNQLRSQFGPIQNHLDKIYLMEKSHLFSRHNSVENCKCVPQLLVHYNGCYVMSHNARPLLFLNAIYRKKGSIDKNAAGNLQSYKIKDG